MPQAQLTSPERYELIDRIAVGGMAEVFRAVAYGAHGFEKTLAIKRILPELARDPEFEERFIGEAKLAVKLSHANVVQVLDFGRLGGTLFIAMELVDGLDLAALCRRYKELGRPIPLPAAFHMAIEIARGLDFAHQHGVVHRDVSPSNILISRAGEVKIADFGIAQAVGDRGAIDADRRRIMGKWRYMSPEQTRGEPLDSRSDLFSAAAVWFELFTGEKLFPGDEAEAIIENIHEMPVPRASERREGLPPRLDEVLARSLERAPARRPAGAAEVLRALVEISYESSIVASALGVSDAVGEVFELGGGVGAGAGNGGAGAGAGAGRPRLDEWIRKHLAGGGAAVGQGSTPEPARRTAVAGAGGGSGGVDGHGGAGAGAGAGAGDESDAFALTARADAAALDGRTSVTLVRSGVDADGVTRLEAREGDADADAGGAGEPGDGARGGAGAAELDRETVAAAPQALRSGRRTGATAIAPEPEPEGGAGRSRRWLAAGGLAAALLCAGAVWIWIGGAARGSGSSRGGRALASERGGAGADLAGADLSPVTAPAGSEDVGAGPDQRGAPLSTLVVDSIPPGARVTIDGARLAEPTPTTTRVRADRPHRLTIEERGYRLFEDDHVRVKPGETVRILPTLVPVRAVLSVSTRPPGAEVVLDGEVLGTSPLRRDDLVPGAGRQLVIRKADYKPITVALDLEDGRPVEIDRRLESSIVYGNINLTIRDSWADVTLGGKPVGRAPSTLRLPVGRHRLRLYNPYSKKERYVTVDVRADKVNQYSFSL